MTIRRRLPSRPRRLTIALAIAATLPSCSDAPVRQTETAGEFAERIGAPAPASSAAAPDAVAGTAAPAAGPDGVSGPAADATGDAATSPCGAVVAAAFLGRYADPDARAALTDTARAAGGVRFLEPGANVRPDPRSTRLNVMLDGDGVIRDLRCG